VAERLRSTRPRSRLRRAGEPSSRACRSGSSAQRRSGGPARAGPPAAPRRWRQESGSRGRRVRPSARSRLRRGRPRVARMGRGPAALRASRLVRAHGRFGRGAPHPGSDRRASVHPRPRTRARGACRGRHSGEDRQGLHEADALLPARLHDRVGDRRDRGRCRRFQRRDHERLTGVARLPKGRVERYRAEQRNV